MAGNNSKALVKHKTRAIQRKVDRHVGSMQANMEVAEAVIDNGTELHKHAVMRIVEITECDNMMLQAASQNLNGSYAELEEMIRRLRADDFEATFQVTVQAKTSMLRHAEEMQLNTKPGALARLGDGVAEALDEWDRSRGGG